MRLAELSAQTGVSAATLKYYLREGLLHPGEAVSKTQSDYDTTHVDRVRLVRALSEVGGLSLATIGSVLEAIHAPGQDHLSVMATAQLSLAPESGGRRPAPESRALAWIEDRGWHVQPLDPFIDELDRAWDAVDAAGIGFDADRLSAYADQVEGIARVDVATVPDDPDGAVRVVVLGTILVDPVLAALRRLAQQHVSYLAQTGSQEVSS